MSGREPFVGRNETLQIGAQVGRLASQLAGQQLTAGARRMQLRALWEGGIADEPVAGRVFKRSKFAGDIVTLAA